MQLPIYYLSQAEIDELEPEQIAGARSMSQELTNIAKREYPEVWEAIAGKRYALPSDLAAGYMPQDNDHSDLMIRFYSYAQVLENMTEEQRNDPKPSNPRDINARVQPRAINQWLRHGANTLYLSPDLGEALMRTDLLPDLQFDDLHWKWDAFRICFPLGLVPIATQRGKGSESIVSVIVHKEVDDLGNHGVVSLYTHALDRDDLNTGCKIYRTGTRDGETLAQFVGRYHANNAHHNIPATNEAVAIGTRLVLNILIFMGTVPAQDEAEPAPLRRFMKEGKNGFRAAIFPVRWVGQQHFKPPLPRDSEQVDTGQKRPAHWVAGHWKRQPFGPARALRKIIWIMPYQTTGEYDGMDR
jgi:hypothetical protein